MSIKKTYIPAKPRSKKLIGVAGGVSSSSTGSTGPNSHTHSNKSVIDQLTQADINVLEKLSLVDGNLRIDANAYSTGDLSAFGLGEGQGGGVTINVIDNLTSTSKTDPLSANMGRYLKTLIDNIEVGEGGQVLVDWEAITGKPTTFAPSAHTHTIGDVTGLQGALDDKASLSQLDDKEDKFTKNSAFNKNFGTGSNDVARGNHTHTFASLTSIPTTLAGYGITDGASKVHTHAISDITDLQTTLADKLETTVFDTHNDDNARHITGAERTKWDTAYGWGNHTNKYSRIAHSGYSNSIRSADNRSVEDTPASRNAGLYVDFKTSAAANLAGFPYVGVLTFRPFGVGTDISGGGIMQIGSNNNSLYYRRFLDSDTWRDWVSIWHSGDFTQTEITNWREVRTWWQNVGQYLKRDATNQALYTDENFYSTKEVSAYGIGLGGGSGGGSMSMMQGWSTSVETENYYLPAKLAVPFYDDTRSRLSTLEAGTAPASHIHPISDVTNLQTALNSKLETTVFDTHNNDNIRHITGAERTKWDTVVTDFAGLEIGGRNLVLKSDTPVSTSEYMVAQYFITEDFIEGKTYTLSLKGTKLASQNFGLWQNADLAPRGNLVHKGNDIYQLTFSSIATTAGNERRIQIYQPNRTTAGLATIDWIKLEKGNKATDWTPAPEDQVSDWLTTDVDSFSYIKNKPTMLSQFIDNIGVAQHRIDFDSFKTTFDTMFRKTSTNEIEAKLSLYTLGGLSAYGFSDEGSSGGGGGIVNILSDWANYDASKSGWALGAGLGKGLYDNKADKTDPRFTDARTPLAHSHIISDVTGLQGALNSKTNQTFSDGLNTRLTSVEDGSATTVNTTGSGNAITSISKSGNIITAKKDLTFALPTDITNAIDGLEIGGRNYIRLGNEYIEQGSMSIAGIKSTSTSRVRTVSPYLIEGGGKYTLSIKGAFGIALLFMDDEGVVLLATYPIYGYIFENQTPITLDIPSEVTSLGFVINKEDDDDIIPNEVVNAHIKLEKGNKATDWSPAPEDQVSDWLTTDLNSFSFIKNKPTKLSQFSNVETAFINKTQSDGWYASLTNFNSHVNNKSNPHEVTKAQVGLGNVTNESKATMFTNPTFTGTTKVTILELNTNWKVLKTGNELEFQYNNVKKATLTPNGDLIVMGGMTAYQ